MWQGAHSQIFPSAFPTRGDNALNRDSLSMNNFTPDLVRPISNSDFCHKVEQQRGGHRYLRKGFNIILLLNNPRAIHMVPVS